MCVEGSCWLAITDSFAWLLTLVSRLTDDLWVFSELSLLTPPDLTSLLVSPRHCFPQRWQDGGFNLPRSEEPLQWLRMARTFQTYPVAFR